MRRTFLLLLLLIAVSSSALATAEFFGQFSHADIPGAMRSSTMQNEFVLGEDFWFDDPNGLRWPVPKGTATDGASIPRACWSLIGGPLEGKYLWAAIVHDRFCEIRSRTADDTHRVFWYGMRAKGVEPWQAYAMYFAVALCGPQWTLTKTSKGTKATNFNPSPCFGGPAAEEVAALSKITAVARTLKTTGGRSFDVGTKGPIAAEASSIEERSGFYRALLASGKLSQSPDQLGLLSTWIPEPFEKLPRWEGGKLPTLHAATVLAPENIAAIDKGRAFVIGKGNADLLFDLENSPRLPDVAKAKRE